MNYNIDTFRVKKLENLAIPLNSFYKHKHVDWHPEDEKMMMEPLFFGYVMQKFTATLKTES